MPSPRDPALTSLHLVAGFFVGVLLLIPTYGALGVTSTGALWAWFVGSIAVVIGVGWLLRVLVVHAVALTIAAITAYAVSVLVGLSVIAAIGDPPDDGALALLAGLPAAVVAAVVATALVGWLEADAFGFAVLALVVLGLGSVATAPAVGDNIAEARDDAAEVAELEASGLTAYLPELGDLEASRSSTSHQDGRLVGYSLRYEREDRDPLTFDEPSLSLAIVKELPAYRECDRSERALYACEDHGDYYVLTGNGDTFVVAARGGTYLYATYRNSTSGLPDPGSVGEALSEAEEVEWTEIVGLE